ncbi:MAG: hypothetical protein M1833_004131 [Piccolia ochrophora]|nr:MAG: hypothetical protein M1833_004131 [Piccolia ochrophora]
MGFLLKASIVAISAISLVSTSVAAVLPRDPSQNYYSQLVHAVDGETLPSNVTKLLAHPGIKAANGYFYIGETFPMAETACRDDSGVATVCNLVGSAGWQNLYVNPHTKSLSYGALNLPVPYSNNIKHLYSRNGNIAWRQSANGPDTWLACPSGPDTYQIFGSDDPDKCQFTRDQADSETEPFTFKFVANGPLGSFITGSY